MDIDLKPVTNPSVSPLKKPNKIKDFFSKYRKVFYVAIPVVIIGVGAALWVMYTPKTQKTDTSNNTTDTTTPQPTTVADALTGEMVDPATAAKPVTAVMIENSTDARPQSGLSQAGVVYEAIAEGGITRFMAIFQQPYPAIIGPVRSLRPYYLDWATEYDIPAVHAGGSQPALAKIGPSGLKNVDALVYGTSYFYRATDRAAPHNLYTKTDMLANLIATLKFNTAPTFKGLARKIDAPVATPTHTKIDITFGSAAYNVGYQYDATSNSYKRFNAGVASIDRNTSSQITVKNVVVLAIPVSYGTQPDGKPMSDYALKGTGKAYVFIDGDVIVGTWSKTSDKSPTQILDSTGTAVKFNVGNTWYEAIPAGNAVTY